MKNMKNMKGRVLKYADAGKVRAAEEPDYSKMSFGKAFAAARKAGKKEFTWKNNERYHTRTKEEESNRKAAGAPAANTPSKTATKNAPPAQNTYGRTPGESARANAAAALAKIVPQNQPQPDKGRAAKEQQQKALAMSRYPAEFMRGGKFYEPPKIPTVSDYAAKAKKPFKMLETNNVTARRKRMDEERAMLGKYAMAAGGAVPFDKDKWVKEAPDRANRIVEMERASAAKEKALEASKRKKASPPPKPKGYSHGGSVKGHRGDGCAVRGRTKGKMY